jgi:hypothetical protein
MTTSVVVLARAPQIRSRLASGAISAARAFHPDAVCDAWLALLTRIATSNP